MESLESSKRQEGLNFHSILPHLGIRGCSAALGNLSCPKGQEPLPLLLSKAVLSFREAELQEKTTFLQVAFYPHHETAGCSWRMWCRIPILSIKTILKRYKVTWVLWGLAISKSWMPNLHFWGYKLSTAVQAPAWLKRNKPGACQSLNASEMPKSSAPPYPEQCWTPCSARTSLQTPAEFSPDKIPSAPIHHTSKCCSSKKRCDYPVFSLYNKLLPNSYSLVLRLWGAWLIRVGFTEFYLKKTKK